MIRECVNKKLRVSASPREVKSGSLDKCVPPAFDLQDFWLPDEPFFKFLPKVKIGGHYHA